MMKVGIPLSSIKEMSEKEFNDFFMLIGIFEDEMQKQAKDGAKK
jgi:hypothetical protein